MIKATEAWPGVYKLFAPWAISKAWLNDWIKTGDGGRKRYHFDFKEVYGSKAWYIPKERIPELRAKAQTEKVTCRIVTETEISEEGCAPVDATAWQKEGLARLLKDKAMLAQWPTGAGKSKLALDAHDAIAGKTLIVAPKIVLQTWEGQQIPKWAPKYSFWEYKQGRKLSVRGELREQADITLVSWGSLHKILEACDKGWGFDLIVFDEIHAGIHGQSARTQKALQLSTRFPDAYRLGLTATPTSANLTDLWSQLNILCPHRWGTFRSWWRYFFEIIPVGYEDHETWGPARKDRLPELIKSIETISHVVTHDQVGDALPPVDWRQLDIGHKAKRKITPPGNVKEWRTEQLATGKIRATAFCDELTSKLKKTTTPVAIITYHRDIASFLTARLTLAGISAECISGDVSPKHRHQVLDETPVAVVTMRSVTEGLDLRRFTQVYVLEAYPVPLFLSQVLGRFIRLYAENPVQITFCRLRGSSDDVVVQRLLTRLEEQRKILPESKTESGLAALLSVDENSDDFLAELRSACEGLTDDDHDSWDGGDEWE